MSPKDGLNGSEKINVLFLPGFEPKIAQPVT
jgi:hypothetical protein